ncbi:Protein of unknown function (DUF581) [Abeliophyllum distichum]|uniref:FLZ-type domain-containing protein n=1 Tax=Abeliophyllum distichum TaxID=126358 RepID=A0ABD1NXW1_9LAMI
MKSKIGIGILTGSLVSGSRPEVEDFAISPTSVIDAKIHSPRGQKNYDVGGVGLGIVAALERSRESVLGELSGNKAVCSRKLSKSNPIPVNFPKNCSRIKGVLDEMEEDYTIVTCHDPSKSYTKVYCDDRIPFRIKGTRPSVFHISSMEKSGVLTSFPASDFLSSCHLCHKKLHGKDIYMYRGEKAFCSTECRDKQIVTDERKEKCSYEASRSVDVSSSPYTNTEIFSTGILAI